MVCSIECMWVKPLLPWSRILLTKVLACLLPSNSKASPGAQALSKIPLMDGDESSSSPIDPLHQSCHACLFAPGDIYGESMSLCMGGDAKPGMNGRTDMDLLHQWGRIEPQAEMQAMDMRGEDWLKRCANTWTNHLEQVYLRTRASRALRAQWCLKIPWTFHIFESSSSTHLLGNVRAIEVWRQYKQEEGGHLSTRPSHTHAHADLMTTRQISSFNGSMKQMSFLLILGHSSCPITPTSISHSSRDLQNKVESQSTHCSVWGCVSMAMYFLPWRSMAW